MYLWWSPGSVWVWVVNKVSNTGRMRHDGSYLFQSPWWREHKVRNSDRDRNMTHLALNSSKFTWWPPWQSKNLLWTFCAHGWPIKVLSESLSLCKNQLSCNGWIRSTAFSKIAPDPRSNNWEHNSKKLVIYVVYWTTDSKSFILSTKNQLKKNSGINYYVLGFNHNVHVFSIAFNRATNW